MPADDEEAAALAIQARVRGIQSRKAAEAGGKKDGPAMFETEGTSRLKGDDESDESDDDEWEPQEKVLWCCPQDSPVRKLCIAVILHPVFDAFILLVIVLNSITMALEDPLEDPDRPSDLTKTLHTLELIFNIIFTVEMTIKIVAMGFVMQTNT